MKKILIIPLLFSTFFICCSGEQEFIKNETYPTSSAVKKSSVESYVNHNASYRNKIAFYTTSDVSQVRFVNTFFSGEFNIADFTKRDAWFMAHDLKSGKWILTTPLKTIKLYNFYSLATNGKSKIILCNFTSNNHTVIFYSSTNYRGTSTVYQVNKKSSIVIPFLTKKFKSYKLSQ